MRIEFQQRISDITDEEREQADRMGLALRSGKKVKYTYRRTYVRLEDIYAPQEIPGIDEYCSIEFGDGSCIQVKGSYDEICELIDTREALERESEE